MGSSLADDVHFNPTALRGIGPVVDPGGRLHWTKSDIRALLALADANRIPIRGADRSVDATMVPCMFTGGISEAAHWLPFREVQNPSLWLWSRLVGLAPWTYEGSRQTKRALDNLIPFSTNLHQLMDKADEIFVTPVETTILALIQLLEEMLANEELRTDLGTRWLWDFAGELKRKMPGREVLGVKASGFKLQYIPKRSIAGLNVLVTERQDIGPVYWEPLRLQSEGPSPELEPGHVPAQWRKLQGAHETVDSFETALFLSPLLAIAAVTISVAARRRESSAQRPDLLFTAEAVSGSQPRPIVDSTHLSRVWDLLGYIVRLIGSDSPSAHRDFVRPADLPFAATQEPARPNKTKREFFYGTVGVLRKPARPGERSSSPPPQGEAMSRWKQLLRLYTTAMLINLKRLDDDSTPLEDVAVVELDELEAMSADFMADLASRVRARADDCEGLTTLLEDPRLLWGQDWRAAETFRKVAVELYEEGSVEGLHSVSSSEAELAASLFNLSI